MLRRKVMPAELVAAWDAFTAEARRVQGARRVVLSCLPVGRVEPAPIAVGLDVFVDELREVVADMQRWRVDEVDKHWRACRQAVDEAMAAVAVAKQVAGTTSELEDLLGAVSDVVEPLGDAYSAAERHWLTLRRRP